MHIRFVPVLCVAVASAFLAGSASAQTLGASSEETASFTASRPLASAPAPKPAETSTKLQLAPVSMDNVYVGNVVPEGGFAEITPPAPKMLAFAKRSAVASTLQVNSNFGVRRDPINGGSRMHTGVDLHATYGQSVGAALAGKVIYAAYRGGYGNLVIVDHGRGISTFYAHLSSIAVMTGQRIVAGETLGYVGSTGRSTGPHLHYEVRARGRALDPSALITFKGKSIFANGRLVDGPTEEGGDETPVTMTKDGKPAVAPAQPPLPLFESHDSLSNY